LSRGKKSADEQTCSNVQGDPLVNHGGQDSTTSGVKKIAHNSCGKKGGYSDLELLSESKSEARRKKKNNEGEIEYNLGPRLKRGNGKKRGETRQTEEKHEAQIIGGNQIKEKKPWTTSYLNLK